MLIFGIIIFVIVGIACYSCCVVSGNISRIEELYENDSE